MNNFTNVETLYERTTKLHTITFKIAEPYAGSTYGEPSMEKPEQVAALVHGIMNADDLDDDREHAVMLALTANGNVRGYKVVASGGLAAADLDPKIVFRAAILLGARSIILAHNHPSGVMRPSTDDIAITRALIEAGRVIGVPVRDHIIIDRHGAHYSMNEFQYNHNLDFRIEL